MRFDLHIHSRHSPDSNSSVKDVINRAKACGINGISITDHNCYSGSEEACMYAPEDVLIIPGAEYSTDQGHFLVYFLKEGLEKREFQRDIYGRFHWQDIVEAAHDQSAVVFIAHPHKSLRLHDFSIWKEIDGVEVYNSRASLCRNMDANIQALDTLKRYKKAFSAGSDAHWLGEIGHAFWECIMPSPIDTTDVPAYIKSALLSGNGKVWGSPTNRFYEPASQILKCFKTGNYIRAIKPLAKMAYSCIHEFTRIPGLGKPVHKGWIDLECKKGGI